MIITISVFGIYNYNLYSNKDDDKPVIMMESDSLVISVADDEEELLKGVTAFDSKDGDVTKNLGVESIGPFNKDFSRQVNYVVFDSDNHVSKASRLFYYKDYNKIHFSLDGPLTFSASTGNINILALVHANDCIDGNITQKVSFSQQSRIYVNIPSDYQVSFEVANSAGDRAILPATVTIYDPEERKNLPQISLTHYLVYTSIGEELNLQEYLKSVKFGSVIYTVSDGPTTFAVDTSDLTPEERKEMKKLEPSVRKEQFKINNIPDYQTPGIYEVQYTIDSLEGQRGEVKLIVIVEED